MLVDGAGGGDDEQDGFSSSSTVLLVDPSTNEEFAMDGSLVFSINAHKELCSVHKPGGVAVSASAISEGVRLASHRAAQLHEVLAASLAQLEEVVLQEREVKLEELRRKRFELQAQMDKAASSSASASMSAFAMQQASSVAATGIDRDDEILQWSNLHKAVSVREEEAK